MSELIAVICVIMFIVLSAFNVSWSISVPIGAISMATAFVVFYFCAFGNPSKLVGPRGELPPVAGLLLLGGYLALLFLGAFMHDQQTSAGVGVAAVVVLARNAWRLRHEMHDARDVSNVPK
jgi:hypothetical protein